MVKFVLLVMSVFRLVVLVYSEVQLICKLCSDELSAQVVNRKLLKNRWDLFKCLVKMRFFSNLENLARITRACSTSHSGGNLVDGSPPALNSQSGNPM